MSIYRATAKLINRIMTGRVPSRAFVVNAAIDNATPGSGIPEVTGHISGLVFRDQINPSTGSFSMPAALAPVSDSVLGFDLQCTVRCEIQAPHIHETSLSPLPGGPIFMNRYFEADFPVGTTSITNYLVQNGWFAAAGSLTNASVPAALNTHLPTMEKRSGSRTGES